MNNTELYRKYLPLSESTYYILLTLTEPLHGYGVMQKVEAISNGCVHIGAGTLYGAFSTLEQEGLIIKVDEQERRKIYRITEKGDLVLLEYIRRLNIMAGCGMEYIGKK